MRIPLALIVVGLLVLALQSQADGANDTRRYTVTVHTSNIEDAGTDADVFIQIDGSQGKTDEVLLDKPDYDDFEKNDTDDYSFDHADLGELKAVTLRHNNKGDKAGWHVAWVTIKDQKTGKTWRAEFNCWLATDAGDRELKASRPLKPAQ